MSPADTVTITANNRLARSLRQAHAREQVRAGRRAWERPAIHAWSAWLAECYHGVALRSDESVPLLLSPGQARALWRRVIRQGEAGAVLLRPAQTAALAQKAWALLQDYRLSLDALDAGESADVTAFCDWAGAFAKLCEKQGWLDPAVLPNWLERRLPAYPSLLPGRLRLTGFDEFTPAERELLSALEAGGVVVERTPFPRRDRAVRRISCADAAAEIDTAAQQARHWLEADPEARIGIVVPNLEAQRAGLARAMETALTPAARLFPFSSPDPPFNLSLGRPLSRLGLVADALCALRLMQGALPWESAGRLLRSPYFAGVATERGARAAMDAWLRKRGGPRWSLAQLERTAEAFGASRWRTAMQRCRRLLEERRDRAPPGAWAQRFGAWLEALGWCRGETLESRDYQTQQAWFELLRGFAGLGAVSGTLSLDEARSTLAELATETIFQPESSDAPVQVLGLIEAAGLEFDYLWVMGLSDDAWPRPAAPNPFLPLALRREHHMPHADARRELAYAERVTERLIHCADQVVLSWPRREGDTELAPSPLLPAAQEHELDSEISPWRTLRRTDSLIAVPDRPPPAIVPGSVRGGSGVLTDQAACPFRAFAARRLAADPLEQPVATLDASHRGRLVHEALEALWSELGSQQALQRLDEAGRGAAAQRAAVEARRRLERKLPAQEEAFWRLETMRLTRLLQRWLEVEARRGPFAVAAREEKTALALAGLELELQVDRRDRLEDGRELIIDYKTGATGHSPKAWLGERPDQPQLPSYALALESSRRLGGLAFALVRAKEPGFSGVIERDGELFDFNTGRRWGKRPAGCDDFATLSAYWRQQLEALAGDFRDGVSHTDPNYPRVCDYCHRQVLCRVREMRRFWDGEGEAGDD